MPIKSESIAEGRLKSPLNWLPIFSNAVALFLLAYGSWLACSKAFQGFEPYDDEGYLLSSLVNFVQHGGLYTTTFAQYGPFFFYLQEFMHWVLRLPFDHDGGRVLTLVYWLSSAALATLFVYRLTTNLLLAAVGFLATLLVSTNLIAEPGHPQEVILVLLQAGLCFSLFSIGAHERWASFLLGGIAACLCLIKINVGVFAAATLYFFYIRRLVSHPRLVMLASSLLALCFPALLMRTYLFSWALPFCMLATLGIAIFLFTLQRADIPEDTGIRELLYPIAGFAAFSGAVLGLVLQHYTPSVLLEGIVLAPLNHPRVFFHPLLFGRRVAILAAGSACIVIAVLWFGPRWPNRAAILAAAKVILGSLALFQLTADPTHAALYLLPLVPLLLVESRPHEGRALSLLPRAFVCSTIVFQFLQAYPVAGSQINVAITPAVSWALLLIWDGACGLENLSGVIRFARSPLVTTSFVGLLLAVAITFNSKRYVVDRSWVPLNLPGARRIQVSRPQAVTLRELTDATREDCSVLYSMPGMFSFNFWSEVPTPNGLNMDGWMTALSQTQQEQIIHVLRSHKNACVTYSPEIVKFWMPMPDRARILAASALNQFIQAHTRSILKLRLDDPEALFPHLHYDLRRVEAN